MDLTVNEIYVNDMVDGQKIEDYCAGDNTIRYMAQSLNHLNGDEVILRAGKNADI